MMSDFVIDQVSWHTETSGNPESREKIFARFRSLSEFLKENGLLARTLGDVDEQFAVRTSDLTDDGRALMKAAYDAWLRRIDRGAAPESTVTLDNALKKLGADIG